MSIEFDNDGQLEISRLNDSEVLKLVDEIRSYFKSEFESWEVDFGSQKLINTSEMSEAKKDQFLNSQNEKYFWSYDTDFVLEGTMLTPVKGLTLHFYGSSFIPGLSFRETDHYIERSLPWESQGYFGVFSLAQAACPFCDGTGLRKSKECVGCQGEDTLVFDTLD